MAANDDQLLRRWLRAKKLTEDSRREADRLEGALRQLHDRLLAEFQIDDVPAAAKLLAGWRQELLKAEQQLQQELDRFERGQGSKLEDKP